MMAEERVFVLPREAIEELAGRMSDRQADALTQYAGLVSKASERLSLVSSGDRARLGEHIVDSAALLRAVCVDDGLADLGSGAGFPGLVVAVLRPRASLILVEAKRRKVAFLKQAARALLLDNVSVIHSRLEELSGGARYALAASRALGSVEKTLALSLNTVAPGGRLVLFKGPGWQGERALAMEIGGEAGAELEREVEIQLPGLGRTTMFVVFHVKPRNRCST